MCVIASGLRLTSVIRGIILGGVKYGIWKTEKWQFPTTLEFLKEELGQTGWTEWIKYFALVLTQGCYLWLLTLFLLLKCPI